MNKKMTKKPRKKWPISKIKSTFSLAINKGDYDQKEFCLLKKNKDIFTEVGKITLDKRTSVIGSSNLDKPLRGKGIGKYFYEQVLIYNKKLATDPSSTSDLAKRVHRSLMKKWDHVIDVYGDIIKSDPGKIVYYPRLKKNKKPSRQ